MHSLEFTRDGSRLVVRGETHLSVLDLRGPSSPVTIPGPSDAFAAIADQIWVVAGSTLTAYDLAGSALGSVTVADPGPTPRLLRSPASRLAAWIGNVVANVTFDRHLVATPFAAEVELALPLSSTRTLVANRQRLSLRDQGSARWTIPLTQLGTVTDAAVVLDGKAVAITTRSAAGQAIAVIGLRDGALLHRIVVGAVESISYAPARGVALVLTPDSRLVLIDLRFGRVIINYTEQRTVIDATIDDAGREIALRLSDQDAVVQISVTNLLAAAAASPTTTEAAIETAIETAAEPVRETAEPAASNGVATNGVHAALDPFTAGELSLACAALPPRAQRIVTSTDETTALLARNRELAIAIVGAAIARAWDEGRIAFQQVHGLPFHSEVSGVTAGQRGLALDELITAQRRLDEAASAAHDLRRALAPRLGPIEALGEELGLSPLARDMLLMVAAPSLWGEMARLYGILSNDEGRPMVDELLLAELLVDQTDRAQIARELDDDGPLVRYGIIQVHPGAMRPFLPLVVEPLVLKLLRGAPVESELEPLTHIVSGLRTFDELRIPTAVKQQLVADLDRASAPLRIAVRGRVGSGRHTLIATLAEASGRQLGVIDATPLVRDTKRIGELAVALDRAHLAGLLPCVDGLELVASHDIITREQIRDLLRRHAGPLAVRVPWEVQPPLDPGHVLVDLPAFSLTDRLLCWERTLADHELRVGELAELADRYAVGPGVIERVAEDVARTSPPLADAGARLEAGIRQHLESRLGSSANRVGRLASWSHVILPPDIQDSLTELIARIKHRRLVFDKWGFDRVMSTSRGVTALFQGGPGTGKTLVASAIANELGMDLYRVDLSRVMSKWIGETEQNLAKLFDAAEDGNTIILFDEADSLFAKRTEVKSSVDRYANLEVNYLLQRIDSFEGIAILTTNFGTSIDAAFKRRLSLRLTFPFPDEDMREKLWRSHLPAELPTTGEFDLAELSRRYQMSGGYIRNVALRAAFLAAEEHSPLTQLHLERAIKAEFREIGKIADSGVLE